MIFDSSAIINLAEAGREESLRAGATLRLAEFEIGNFVWNRIVNLRVIDEKEGSKLLAALEATLRLMGKVELKDTAAALSLALKERITYYDAFFLAAAAQYKAKLVTDDQLLQRAGKKYVEVMKSEDF